MELSQIKNNKILQGCHDLLSPAFKKFLTIFHILILCIVSCNMASVFHKQNVVDVVLSCMYVW